MEGAQGRLAELLSTLKKCEKKFGPCEKKNPAERAGCQPGGTHQSVRIEVDQGTLEV